MIAGQICSGLDDFAGDPFMSFKRFAFISAVRLAQ